MNEEQKEKELKRKNKESEDKTSSWPKGWTLACISTFIMLAISIFLPPNCCPSDFRLQEFLQHPLSFLLLLCVFAVTLNFTLRFFAPKFDFLADAILVVSIIGLVLEVRHIKDFFQEGLKDILIESKFVNSLSLDKKDKLLESLIQARLGSSKDVNDEIMKIIIEDLYTELDSKQYIVSETRKYTTSWLPDNTAMRHQDEITYTVRVFGSSTQHKYTELLSGNIEYTLRINGEICFSFDADKDAKPTPVKEEKVSNVICSVIPTLSEKNEYRVDIILDAPKGEFDIKIDRNFIKQPVRNIILATKYYKKELNLEYRYPKNCQIQLYGFGDIEKEIGSTINPREIRNEMELNVSFSSGYARGELFGMMRFVCN